MGNVLGGQNVGPHTLGEFLPAVRAATAKTAHWLEEQIASVLSEQFSIGGLDKPGQRDVRGESCLGLRIDAHLLE